MQQCKRAHYHLLNMQEEKALAGRAPSPGSGLATNKATGSSPQMEEEGARGPREEEEKPESTQRS